MSQSDIELIVAFVAALIIVGLTVVLVILALT